MAEPFSGSQPIYLQIIQKLCGQIVRGELRPGDKMPSVRDMAVQYGVNPNTVQRVNMELERLAVVESKRGQGTYVTEDRERLADLRERLIDEKIGTFVDDMTQLGFTEDEIVHGLKDHFDGKR